MSEGPTPGDREPPDARRWPSSPTWLVAAGAVVLLHQLAYLIAHPDPLGRAMAADGHAYLEPVARVGLVVAAAVAVWMMTCRAMRLLGSRIPPTRELAGAIGVLFLAQETLERLAQGGTLGDVVAEPAVWIGLALIPLLAGVTHGVLAAGSRLRLPSRSPLLTPPPAHGWTVLFSAVAPLALGVVASAQARAPPSLPD